MTFVMEDCVRESNRNDNNELRGARGSESCIGIEIGAGDEALASLLCCSGDARGNI